MTDRPIRVYIESRFDLTVDEVWPDGDHPEDVTAEAVIEVMKQWSTISNLQWDWNLLPDEVVVVVDGCESTWG